MRFEQQQAVATEWTDLWETSNERGASAAGMKVSGEGKPANCARGANVKPREPQTFKLLRKPFKAKAFVRQRVLQLLRNLLLITLHLHLIDLPSNKCDAQANTVANPFDLLMSEPGEDHRSTNAEHSRQARAPDFMGQQNQQLQMQEPSSLLDQMIGNYQIGDEIVLASPSEDPFLTMQSRQQAQMQHSIEDLLESQPSTTSSASAPSSASASQAAKASSSGQESAKSKPARDSGQQSGGAGSAAAGLLASQLSAGANLLQQLGSQSTGLLATEQTSAASLFGPSRNQPESAGSGARKPQSSSGGGSEGPNVGQGINGNIHYDSDQNAINGFIEWPSLGLNGSSKPSLSSIKPFLLAALKTVPSKLGSVGWKLLQLIAWKKIYKTHHPKSGEIIFEQELKSSGKESSGGAKYGGGKGGAKTIEIDLARRPHKTSKVGHTYAGGPAAMLRGPHMMHSANINAGGFGASNWGFGLEGSPAMSASVAYQRHLLPQAGSQLLQHQPAQQQATAAAAAAAAATAAAIQAQWAQSQLLMEEPELGGSRANQSAGVGLNRRRSPFGGNWFATPAHAYAAAAAAANAAATATAVSQQSQPLHRLGPNGPTLATMDSNVQDNFQQALTGMMYQNLFDNAAALAVQNTVKLPHTSQMDYLDQSDSLSGSSSLSLGSNSMAESDSWQQASGGLGAGHRSGLSMAAQKQPSDSLLGLNEDGSSLAGDLTGPSSLASVPDFDDTPAAKFISAAMNETRQAGDYLRQLGIGRRASVEVGSQ